MQGYVHQAYMQVLSLDDWLYKHISQKKGTGKNLPFPEVLLLFLIQSKRLFLKMFQKRKCCKTNCGANVESSRGKNLPSESFPSYWDATVYIAGLRVTTWENLKISSPHFFPDRGILISYPFPYNDLLVAMDLIKIYTLSFRCQHGNVFPSSFLTPWESYSKTILITSA